MSHQTLFIKNEHGLELVNLEVKNDSMSNLGFNLRVLINNYL